MAIEFFDGQLMWCQLECITTSTALSITVLLSSWSWSYRILAAVMVGWWWGGLCVNSLVLGVRKFCDSGTDRANGGLRRMVRLLHVTL